MQLGCNGQSSSQQYHLCFIHRLSGTKMSIIVLLSLWLLFIPTPISADPIPITVPSAPSSGRVVRQDFLGISFELSYLDDYRELRSSCLYILRCYEFCL